MTLKIILDTPLTNPTEDTNIPSMNEIQKAAQLLGRLAGRAKSARKAAAARENGKLGGRPPGSKKKTQTA